MVGSAIVRGLSDQSETDEVIVRTREQVDLTDRAAVDHFFKSQHIDVVYLCAALAGGIKANHAMPAEFIFQNLAIASNVIDGAFRSGVKRLLYFGSSCIYPRDNVQPMKESSLLGGKLEETNEAYAIAKICGLKLCEFYTRQYSCSHGIDYRAVMPTNLYGIGDNYHPQNSHVIPGMIGKFVRAKNEGLETVHLWGTGAPLREFLFVDDLVDACHHIMKLSKEVFWGMAPNGFVNVGSGQEISISDLSKLVADAVGYEGHVAFDSDFPDGVERKLVDSSLIGAMGWAPKVRLSEGLPIAISDYFRRYSEYE